MESTEPSPLDLFKSKKILHSSTPTPSDKNPQPHPHPDPNPSPWSSKTPEKPIVPPRRTRNSAAALSLKEVRLAAKNLQEPALHQKPRPDPLMPAALKERIPSWPESSPAKVNKPDNSIKLPEKYDILDKFFSSLDSSIRLLRMKGSTTTFTNISPKMECLTDRRFTYSHLAQLKFILPEAIEIKKILMHDERTSCMKPDLYIALHVDELEKNVKKKSDGGNVQLRKIFHSRLLDFFKSHPGGDEVPEEALPEPFNQSKTILETNLPRISESSTVGETQAVALSEQQPIAASHLSRSFTRHFSPKVTGYETGESKQQERVVSGHASSLVSEPDFAQINLDPKNCTKVPSKMRRIAESSSTRACPLSPPPATPVKDTSSCMGADCPPKETAAIQGTPSGSASTPVKLMSATPVLQPPKRCFMSPDDDLNQLPNKLVRRPSRSRSLKFDNPVKSAAGDDEVQEAEFSSVDSDVLDVLSDNLIQSIREKERKAFLEQDPAISQAKWRKQMLTSLPRVFDMIYFLFQSIRRSVITKEELMHKIISNQLHVVDRREVEEQLKLLRELVPEWIYEKSSSSGDSLLCVNKIASPEILRTRLAEAK
ncbi:CDT1-like protein a, chloroplastic [Coffea arabica]|uniref:CDT1-like protein a, chloroplastic n=1 Tax=Coffea arabica TaxID=13443 RepID=A0A6P6UXG9_COFAR|nr:CDT1-like protein a, chloroplastic [Coffea arabica]